MDFTYLEAQTCGDDVLEDELLVLFVAQARGIISALATGDSAARDDAAHLLRGSARAIGADEVAMALDVFQAVDPADRLRASIAYRDLRLAFTVTEQSIAAHRAARKTDRWQACVPRP